MGLFSKKDPAPAASQPAAPKKPIYRTTLDYVSGCKVVETYDMCFCRVSRYNTNDGKGHVTKQEEAFKDSLEGILDDVRRNHPDANAILGLHMDSFSNDFAHCYVCTWYGTPARIEKLDTGNEQ